MCSELKIAIKAAKDAGDVILKYYKSKYEIRDKSYHNPVTTADKEADETIKKILLDNFPNYGWLSEETVDSNERLLKEKIWVVDPLDGTKEFIEGIPNFVVSIGLVQDGVPILGVLYNPVTKELFSASKGKGAFLNNKSISCSAKKRTEEMKILNSRSETRQGLWGSYKDKFKILEPIGSVAYKLGLIAAAKADVFASLRPKNEWDICAGNCIINESGGKLIDLNGNQRKYNLKNTLIKPGLIAGDIKAVDKTYLTLKR
jgi:myo-inositol-1(or 4)-monophosphatase